jgi:hypothetical protein
MTNATVSYSVRDIDGRPVAASYHGQREKIAITGCTPVITFALATRTPWPRAPVFIPAERKAEGALAAGFVVASANKAAPPM